MIYRSSVLCGLSRHEASALKSFVVERRSRVLNAGTRSLNVDTAARRRCRVLYTFHIFNQVTALAADSAGGFGDCAMNKKLKPD